MSRAIALAGIVLGGLALTGCVHDEDARAKAATTPSQLYALKAESQTDDIMLAVHVDGLSGAQVQAVQGLADRWRQAGAAQAVRISAPQSASDQTGVYKTAVYQYALAVRSRLVAAGVPATAIQQDAYDAGNDPKAPLKVGFVAFKADVPTCGKSWDNLTATESNVVQSNFGCAVTANIASMIADPADIAQPRDGGSADADRRITVIQAYRKGALTAAVADKQASGAISQAVGGSQ